MSRTVRSDVLIRSWTVCLFFLAAGTLASFGTGLSLAQSKDGDRSLLEALKDPDASVRQTAATLLGRQGHRAPAAAVSALADALKDKDLDVRGAAVMALGRIGSKAKSATPKLADVLADANRDLRCAAALSLARIGKDAGEALPKLTAMSEKDDKVERIFATYALIAVAGGKVEPRLRSLVDFLSDASPQVRGSAAYVLGELGPEAKEAIGALTRTLIDGDKEVRKAAADALAEMGPDARDAVPSLILLLQDKETRASAQAALSEMGLSVGRTGMFFLTRAINQKSYEQMLTEYEADALKTGEAKAPMKRLAEIQAFIENAQSIEVYRLLPTEEKKINKISYEAAEVEYRAAVARAEKARVLYEGAKENTNKPALSEKELAVLRGNWVNAVIDAEDKLQLVSRLDKEKLPLFHGHDVYGQAVVQKVERRELTSFLQTALHWNPYRQLPSFKARYGLRAVQGKRTIDLVISTDSNRINVFEGNEPKGAITILSGKSTLFEDLLREQAKKEPEKKQPDVKKDEKKQPDVKKDEKKQPDVKKDEKKQPDVKKDEKKQPDVKKDEKKQPDVKKEKDEKKKESTGAEVKFVNSTKVTLHYNLRDVGPSGVSQVELWFTLDGRTWSKYDRKFGSDSKSATFDVVGEGRYGVTLIAQSGVGRAEKPPQTGDRPQLWFEVDTTKPVVKLDTPVIGEGADRGKLFITWNASDKNLDRAPITLSYAEQLTGPWTPIKGAEKLANTGRFVWALADNPPYRFFVKAEAADRAGNVGQDVTAELVSVDLATPRAVISGIEAASK